MRKTLLGLAGLLIVAGLVTAGVIAAEQCQCNGTGVVVPKCTCTDGKIIIMAVDKTGALTTTKVVCPACGGTGKLDPTPCWVCRTKDVKRARLLKFRHASILLVAGSKINALRGSTRLRLIDEYLRTHPHGQNRRGR